jgi:hypothetical protein
VALRLLPDAEAVVIEWLLSVEDVTDLIEDRISRDLPPTVVYPYVTVQRVGGRALARRHLDAPVLQFDIWGEVGQDEAVWEVCETVRQAMDDLQGKTVGGAVVGGVYEVIGPTRFTDPDTGRPRRFFRVETRKHPE